MFDAEENPVFGHWGDVFTNPGDTEADMIDSAGQCLRFRVGPVFGKEILKSPGIWISYQEKYQKTELKGDFLMSAETWKAIKNQIDKRIKTFNAKAYSFKIKKK
jgi:hypothetical protein